MPSRGGEWPPDVILDGDLTLRRWRPEDLDELRATVMRNTEHLARWMAWAQDSSPAALARFLRDTARRWERRERFEYAIRQGPLEALVGGAGLMARIGPRGLEIGYWVDERQTRRRVATRAVGMLVTAAFDLEEVDHVEIRHDVANRGSAGVPELLGFERLGVFQAQPSGASAETGEDAHWRLEATGSRRVDPRPGTPAAG